MVFMTRIHYKASSCKKWGEHEIDYVLLAQRDVSLNLNSNEVSQVFECVLFIFFWLTQK